MKILFSPSEEKLQPQDNAKFSPRITKIYQQYKNYLLSCSDVEALRVMGYQKMSLALDVLQSLQGDFKGTQAISLYRGVGYEALDYESLESQEFILDNVWIFSNLFGAIQANEILPFYKLKQGEGFEGFKTKQIYEEQKAELDALLENELVVDLRAGFYKKLYTPITHCINFDFLQAGKRISHYAKYYRGLALREIARNRGIEGIEERMESYGLECIAKEEKKKETLLVFNKN